MKFQKLDDDQAVQMNGSVKKVGCEKSSKSDTSFRSGGSGKAGESPERNVTTTESETEDVKMDRDGLHQKERGT